MEGTDQVRFAAIGLRHQHVDILVQGLLGARATLAAVVEENDEQFAQFTKNWPDAPRRALDEVLADETIQLAVTAAVPAERAHIAAAAMRHGMDVLTDKPCCLTSAELECLRQTQQETGRHLIVWFSERLHSRAMTRALELIQAGAIGDVLHFAGLGPHRLGLLPRHDWFFEPSLNGGILVDLGCHQIDAFLTLTGSSTGRIVAARATNLHHPERPRFQDIGDLLLEAPGGASGYARVDWHSPDGLDTWGDGRTFLVGSTGTLELRRVIDPAGRGLGEHLFLADKDRVRHITAADTPLEFSNQVVADVRDGTETAMSSAHAFTVIELSLIAQEMADHEASVPAVSSAGMSCA